MNKKDKVRVVIGGRPFYLTSGDNSEYLKNIAKKIDDLIGELIKNNIGLTFEQAAVLVALKYCDDYEKAVKSNEKQTKEDEDLGRRLVNYSKELTRATARIKALEKELAGFKKEQGGK